MGRLRIRGLLVEATIPEAAGNEELILTIPVELREPLKALVKTR